MIKKTEKDFDNVYGIEKMDDSFSFDKPFLLTMIPINMNERDANGYFSRLTYLMQIRSANVDSDYTIGNVPFDILSGEYRDKLDEKMIKNIPIGDVLKAKRHLHNMNIFSYCGGNYNTTELLHKIHDYLEQINYSSEEIKEIMQEIFVLQVVDNDFQNDSFKPIPYATTVIVQDIYDMENGTHVLDFNSDNPFISTMQIDGTRYMLYNSFGEESLAEEDRDHEFKKDYFLAPVVNTVISLYLIKALSNSLSDNSRKNITIYSELQQIIQIAKEFVDSKNKDLEDLTIDEKEELNKILFEEIKKTFTLNIPFKKLTNDEKEYLREKDNAIYLMKFMNVEKIFVKYHKCLELIDKIIETYNNYLPGEIVDQRYIDNSGVLFDITRDDDIKSKINLLNDNIDGINEIIDGMKIPDTIPQRIKDELKSQIDLSLEDIKNRINSPWFQEIIVNIQNQDVNKTNKL